MTDAFIESNSIRVVLRRMPGNVRALSAPLGDGYSVIVNDALGPRERLQALDHELEHIERGDHFNPDYVEYAY